MPAPSIRRQLTAQILIGTFVLLLAAGTVFAAMIHVRLVGEFDRALEAEAGALESLTSREGRKLDMEFGHEGKSEFEDEAEPEYFEVFLADGTVLRKSETLGQHDLPLDPKQSDEEAFRNARLANGQRARLVQIAFAPEVDEPDPADLGTAKPDQDIVELPEAVELESLRLVLVVARSREHLDSLLTSIYLTLAGLALVMIGGIFFVVRRAIGRGFEPIDAMNTQIARIGPETLGNRIHVASPPEELATILAALNGFVARVELGFARERRFSSDVAHELRTPVAELRTACEVGAKWPDDAAANQRLFQDVREIALQMERIVTNLLTLARCDSGAATVVAKRVRVARLVDECWHRANGKAAEKKPRLENRVDPGTTIESDEEKLEMIVQNVLENAMAHGVPNGAVVCQSFATESGLELSFTNRTANLLPEDLAHLFERFWQKDSARTDANRFGLGLSIVQALANLLGIRLRADLKDGSLFELRLLFPPQ